MRLLKLQKSGFVDFERLRKEPFSDNLEKSITLIAVVTVICIGISRMSFPQQINIGQHRYQLVEKSTEDSENKLGVDSPEQ